MSLSCLLMYPQSLAPSLENKFRKAVEETTQGEPLPFAIEMCCCPLPSDFLPISTQAVRGLGLLSELGITEARYYVLGSMNCNRTDLQKSVKRLRLCGLHWKPSQILLRGHQQWRNLEGKTQLNNYYPEHRFFYFHSFSIRRIQSCVSLYKWSRGP